MHKSPQNGLLFALILALLPAPALHAAAQPQCPNLAPFYAQPATEAGWRELEQAMQPLMADCLQNAEYFALYGAVLMNSGLLTEALESLERALLLDPAHGGAMVDYAEALYRQGQVFTALELNDDLLQRDGLPPGLRDLLLARQEQWRGLTRDAGLQLDLLAGYDSNLNGAPTAERITLTLSGEPVFLTLAEEFRAREGAYANLRLAGSYRRLAPRRSHDFLVSARGRLSEHSDSDQIQLDSRYLHRREGEGRDWLFNAGMSHLFFGGSALYTATEGGARWQGTGAGCNLHAELTLQHQHYHEQNVMNALESRAGAGYACPLFQEAWRLGMELNRLHNRNLDASRPGGSRGGWQANLNAQARLAGGALSLTLTHTRMDDSAGYSDLLAGGRPRHVRRRSAILQYRRPLRPGLVLQFNLFHQNQNSNIDLFEYDDTSAEIGFSLSL